MTIPVGFQKDAEGYYIYKASYASKDYKIDFSAWLAGDTIISVVWTVPTGIINVSEINTPTTATIYLSGGTENNNYQISCYVTTALGKNDTVKFRVVIEND